MGLLARRSEGVGRDREEDGAGRGGGQQGTSDYADALSLVRLLSAAVLRVCDEPPSSSVLSSEGADEQRVPLRVYRHI